MSAKRIQLADGTWQALDLFSRDSTKTFQERADESFADLLAKPGRPQRGARATGRGLFSALQQCEGRHITFVAFPGILSPLPHEEAPKQRAGNAHETGEENTADPADP
jgi:hypothetical protein